MDKKSGHRRKGIQLGWQRDGAGSQNVVGFHTEALARTTRKRAGRRKPWLLSEPESHLLTIAPTGAGKGRCSIIPTCLTWPGSMVVVDPKGEAAAVTAQQRENLGNEVVIIDPFHKVTPTPATFNPFEILPFTDMGVEEFSLLFPSLLHPDRDYSLAREPFWDLRGDDLIAGVTAFILSALPKEEQNMNRLRKDMKNGDVVYNLAVILDTLGKQMCPMAYENISALVSVEEKCRSGILATAQQHFAIYADPIVSDSLSTTSFDLEKFQRGDPMTIYLVLPTTRLNSHQALLRIWLSSLIALLKSRTTRPELSTLLMVDEAAQLGRMTSLLDCVTLLRGYGVRTWTFWQSKNQLEKIYGLDAEVIMDNCGVIQTFGSNNHTMACGLSKLYGQEYSPQEVLNLPGNHQLILTPGGHIQEIEKLDYLKDSIYRGKYQPNPLFETKAKNGLPR